MSRMLSNFAYVEVEGKQYKRGLPAALVGQTLIKLVHPIKLRRIGPEVIAISDEDGRTWRFAKETQLFGWIASQNITVSWSNAADGCVTKGEFLASLAVLLPEIDGVRLLPHEPPIKSIHYAKCGEYGGAYTGRLDELVDFWLPYTPYDRSLIKAAFCTPFWGGRPGGRPAISIESDGSDNGRGIGKSTLMYSIASLAGGHIDCRLTEDMDQIKKRILTSMASVICFDNCKTARISSGDLEGLITAPTVSGWRIYFGNGGIGNYFTYAFSMNDAAFSADMSSRSIRIVLSRRGYAGTWDAALQKFLDEHREAVINDCIWTLRRPAVAATRYIRFSNWQLEVLSKIDPRPEMADLLLSRQVAVDADADAAEDLSSLIAASLAEHVRPGAHQPVHLDPNKDVIIAPRTTVCAWIRRHRDRNVADSTLTHEIKRARIPQLKEAKYSGIRMWKWEPAGPHALGGAWRIMTTNPRDPAQWHVFQKELGADSDVAAPEVPQAVPQPLSNTSL